MSKNVFKDIGFSDEKAQLLELKSSILIRITQLVEKHEISRRQLEKILDIPQPRVSELMTGKIDRLRVDTLLTYFIKLAAHLDMTVKIDLKTKVA